MQAHQLILAALVGILSASATSAATYSNVRYAYSVTYPDDQLKPLPEPDAGDGIVMKAKAGPAEVRVWGEYNITPYSPEDIAKLAEQDCPHHKASYRVTKASLVAVSCALPSTILYQKTLIREGRMATLWAEYPSSEKSKWDALVAQMAKSLRIYKSSF